jgi:leucyl aminopeptidase
VQVSFSSQAPGDLDADTIVVGALEGEPLPPGAPAALQELIDSGEAKRTFKSLALAHDAGRRWLLVGMGPTAELSPERARVAAATAMGRARELSALALGWLLPAAADPALAGAVVEGTMLADYRFDSFKSPPPDEEPESGRLERLVVCVPGTSGAAVLADAVSQAAIVGTAVNRARDLQNRPGNDLTPTALAEHARALGAEIEELAVAVEGADGLRARSMGAFASVAQGSSQEPALITIRYEPERAQGPLLGLVGKAVTFDSGGISLKPGAKMADMKFDMSGGAAVIEAVAAIARLDLPVRIVAVVGATENLPSGAAVKPGDIVRASNGRTIEITNTDAEGRLVLADCICHAIAEGAERVVDLATLTGAVIIALGSTHAGLMSNDDELATRVSEAGERSGELVWRLPLHTEYEELVKGTYADLDNAPEARKAGSIVGATFLAGFAGEVPWAHLDIAGSAWDLGRAYAPKGAAGYGVRLLVELARSYGV